jgi:flagellar biosynthesis/type III secretory pathway protein FliH
MNVLEQVQAIYDRWEQAAAARGRKEGHQEGRKEGRKEGEGKALLLLLERRFGVLPESVTARVAQSSTRDIERWLDRVLDAASLDDVFAG